MANTLKVLILISFSFTLFQCSGEEQNQSESTEVTAILECKPIIWPDSSTSFSVYAIIGTNQTKIADVTNCSESSLQDLPLNFSSKEIISILKVQEEALESSIFLEKKEGEYLIEKITKDTSITKRIANFKNGKFFFSN